MRCVKGQQPSRGHQEITAATPYEATARDLIPNFSFISKDQFQIFLPLLLALPNPPPQIIPPVVAPQECSSILGEGSGSKGHDGEAQYSKKTKLLRQPLPIQKYGAQRVHVPWPRDDCPNCAPRAPWAPLDSRSPCGTSPQCWTTGWPSPSNSMTSLRLRGRRSSTGPRSKRLWSMRCGPLLRPPDPHPMEHPRCSALGPAAQRRLAQ